MRDQRSPDQARAEMVVAQISKAREEVTTTILESEFAPFEGVGDIGTELDSKFHWKTRSKEEERHRFVVQLMEVPTAQHKASSASGESIVDHERTVNITVEADLVSNPVTGETRIEIMEVNEIKPPAKEMAPIVVQSGKVEDGKVTESK